MGRDVIQYHYVCSFGRESLMVDRRAFLAGGLAVTFLVDNALADEPVIDLGKVKNKKSIDRRSDKSPVAWRMAVFLARGGVPGHAYVALMTFQDDIQGFVTNGVWGLYPVSSKKWTLGAVPGGLEIRPDDSEPNAALLVWINPDQFANIEGVANRYNADGEWQLLLSDCVSLLADSAREAGLSTPGLTLRPLPFVEDLMAMND